MTNSIFNEENEHLKLVKEYMEAVILKMETSTDEFNERIKEAFSDEGSKQSSNSYINLLTNTSFFQMSEDDLKLLKKSLQKPYFSRLDFQQTNAKEIEKLYIGKTSLYAPQSQEQVIIDWRSPIANLYYDGRLGEVSYTSQNEEYTGYLSLKRQLMIEGGELVDFRDIDLTTHDELLQESLVKSSTNRLTEIVTTIQEEQNKVIRADLTRPIIVQGAAGSGKTTIALHRISYFIYQYKQHFLPQQLMIIAPNNLFIHYISEALPELGVEKIKQTTYEEYVMKCLDTKFHFKNSDRLSMALQTKNVEQEDSLWLCKMKSSSLFQTIISNYLRHIYLSYLPTEDLYVDKFRVFSHKRMKKLLMEEFTYLPFFKRLDKLKAVMQLDLKNKKATMIENVEQFYDTKIDQAYYGTKDEKLRQERVTKRFDKKQERLGELQQAIKSSIPAYMKTFTKKTLIQFYEELFLDPSLLHTLADGLLTKKDAKGMCTIHQKQKKKYEREDLALLLLLKTHLFGIDKQLKVRNIVIDEAQDYSFMELLALKQAIDSDMFTLVGDLAQGIHSYRGLQSWQEVQTKIFPRATYMELQKSYRTTVEIMNKANVILQKLPLSLPKVEPVVRHGEAPRFIIKKEGVDFSKQLAIRIRNLQKEGFKTFALIGKTDEECQKLFELFKEAKCLNVSLMVGKKQFSSERILILPSYLAKGLEFDCVCLFTLDEPYDMNIEMDVKLLYVAMTRPLHRLYLFGNNKGEYGF